jgi:hypothetical protein
MPGHLRYQITMNIGVDEFAAQTKTPATRPAFFAFSAAVQRCATVVDVLTTTAMLEPAGT